MKQFTEAELDKACHTVLRRFHLKKNGQLKRQGMVHVGFMVLVKEELNKDKKADK